MEMEVPRKVRERGFANTQSDTLVSILGNGHGTDLSGRSCTSISKPSRKSAVQQIPRWETQFGFDPNVLDTLFSSRTQRRNYG